MSRDSKPSSSPERVEQNMTPMIDIVFQLLTFFLLTFHIASAEGDFQVKMPLAQAAANQLEELPPLVKVKLTADADGNLKSIDYNGQRLASRKDSSGKPDHGYGELHARILAFVGNDRGPGGTGAKAEVEIDG